MPIPSDRLIGDIHRTIQQQRQQVEQQRAQQCWPGPDPVRPLGALLRWMCLTADLAAATGTPPLTPNTVNANPVNWSSAANAGAGGYSVDTGTTYTVMEATGKSSYSSGQWVLCRPVMGTNGAQWEPVASNQFHIGKLSGTLSAGSSATAEIWGVTSGSYADQGSAVTVYDWLLPSGGSLPSGTPIEFFQDAQSGRWFVIDWQVTYGYGTALTTGTTGGWDAYSNYALPIGFPATSTPANVTVNGSNALVVAIAGEYSVTGQASLGPDWTPNCSGTGFIPGTNQYDMLGVTLSAYLNGSPTNTILSASSDAGGTGAVGYIQITYEDSGTPTTTIVPLPPISLSFNTQMTLAAGDALTLVLSSSNVSSGLVSNPQVTVGRCQMSVQLLNP